MTIPIPIYLGDDLLLRCHESINGAHPIGLLRATLDACKRSDSVVDDDSDLLAR